MDMRTKNRIAEILQVTLWDNPGKYLGLPSEWGRSRSSPLSWIKERIFHKLEGWKECTLNQVGKEVLIKAVIQAIPSYAMAVVRFPKNFCKNICASVARFSGSPREGIEGFIGKKWEVLTQSKSAGGLGFKEFNDMNSALLAKQSWRIIENPDALLVQSLKAIYYPREDFIREKRRRGDSWVWASIMHGRDVVLHSARWAVGDGTKIRIREDCWLPTWLKIEENLPPEVVLVADILDFPNHCWNIGKIKGIFTPAIVIQILQTPISWQGGADILWWPFSKSGDFSVKSCYYQINSKKTLNNQGASSSSSIPKQVWKLIWKISVPQKIKMFLWKLCNNSLPVKENLRKRKVLSSGFCPFCHFPVETIEHSLLLCDWTRMVWLASQIQCVPNIEHITRLDLWLLQRIEAGHSDQETKVFYQISIVCFLWAIWKERSQAFHEGRNPNPWAALQMANLIINDYFSHWCKQKLGTRPCASLLVSNKMWRPPPSGALKINTDACFDREKRVAQAGIVIRDENGKLLGGHTKKYPTYSPMMAEALAVREALALALNCNMGKTFIETDCQEVVRACRNEIKVGEIVCIIKDIQSFKLVDPAIGLTWVSREGNQATHHVAQPGSRNTLSHFWCYDPPPSLCRILESDRNSLVRNQADLNHPLASTSIDRHTSDAIFHGRPDISFPFDPGTNTC